MALGQANPGPRVKTDEADLNLGPDRVVGDCSGVFSNGAEWRIVNGVVETKGKGAKDFSPANRIAQDEVKAALEAQFGAGRAKKTPDGKIVLQDIPERLFPGLRARLEDAKQTTHAAVDGTMAGTVGAARAGVEGLRTLGRSASEVAGKAAGAAKAVTEGGKTAISAAMEGVGDAAKRVLEGTGTAAKDVSKKTGEAASGLIASAAETAKAGVSRVHEGGKEFLRKGTDKAKYPSNAKEARALGMVSVARIMLETTPRPREEDMITALEGAFPEKKSLARVALAEAGDMEKNREEAEEVVQGLSLVRSVALALKNGQAESAIKAHLNASVQRVNGRAMPRCPSEVRQIVEIAMERGIELHEKNKEKQGKRHAEAGRKATQRAKLDERIAVKLALGEDEASIRAALEGELATHQVEGETVTRTSGEIKKIIDEAFSRAEAKREKRPKGNKQMEKYAKTARTNGMVSIVRKKLEDGEDIEGIKKELKRMFKGLDEIDDHIDIAFAEARNKKNNNDAALQVVKALHLGHKARVQLEAGIEAKDLLEDGSLLFQEASKFQVDGAALVRAVAETEEILRCAVEVAQTAIQGEKDAKGKQLGKNKRRSLVPGRNEFNWDNLLRQKGIVSKIRLLRERKTDISDAQLRTEVMPELAGVPRADEIFEYALACSRNNSFHKRAADIFVFNHGLDQTVREKLRQGIDLDEIKRDLLASISREMPIEESDEIIEAAFARAEAVEKHSARGRDIARHLPFTEERKWDAYLIKNGIYTLIRTAKKRGFSDEKIREILEGHPAVTSHKTSGELVDFALRHWSRESLKEKSANHIVKEFKLGELVHALQTASIPASEAEIRSAIKDAIPLIMARTMMVEEFEEIVVAASEAARLIKRNEAIKETLWRKPLKIARAKVSAAPGKAWEWTRNKAWPAVKSAPGKTLDFLKDHSEDIKDGALTIAKGVGYTAAGVAALGITGVVGTLALGWHVIKKAAPLTFNVGKHLIVDSIPVVQTAVRTVAVDVPVAAAGLVASPFIRGFQGARAAYNYVKKPIKKQAHGITAPLTWLRNGLSSLWYRTKQAPLALAAAALFSLYGAGEGGVNGLARIAGTDWKAPELAVFHSTSHAAPAHEPDHAPAHAPDHAHGAH